MNAKSASERRWLTGVVALAIVGCKVADRAAPTPPATASVQAAAPAKPKLPEVYPPPEYVAKGPPLVRRDRPVEADIPNVPLTGASEGYRFDAKAVVLESKQTGWSLSVYARDVEPREWFPPTRAPQFHLSIGQVKLEKGTVLRGPLEQTPKLWFQTIGPTLAIQSFASPSSYCVVIDEWEVEPFDGDWKEAGVASLRIYLYVAGHNCAGCFAGAQIGGVFKGARVRYFLAPP